MQYHLYFGRKVQLWERGKQYKKLIGIGHYKGSERFLVELEGKVTSKWIKLFSVTDGKYKGHIITELECEWNPLTIGDKETTGLS